MEFLFAWMSSPEAWLALGMLTLMEVVLGIDNLIFIAVLSKRAPAGQEKRARTIGIAMALIIRLLLLLAIGWIVSLKQVFFTFGDFELTWKGLILLAGGLFLVYKATQEIWETIEGDHHGEGDCVVRKNLSALLLQMFILNAVFSIDSVITAVGLTDIVMVMILGVVISTIVMLVSAEPLTNFVERHPTVQMLAFSLLMLIGGTLIMEGLGMHPAKWAVYAIMGFAVGVEALNLMARGQRKDVHAMPRARRDAAGVVESGADALKDH